MAASAPALVPPSALWTGVVTLAIIACAIAWWLLRERRITARRMLALLQRADCMVWEADVRRSGTELVWSFKTQPSGLFTRLFADMAAPRPGELWPDLDLLDRTEMNAKSRQALASGAPGYQQEFRVRKRDMVFWIQEIVTITVEAPDRWHLVGVDTDVTAWRAAVAAMQAKEEQVHQILARADCLLWRATVTRDGDALHWGGFQMPTSGLYPRLFGDRDPQVGSKLWSFIKVPALAEMNARSRAAVLSGQAGYEQEFCAITLQERIWLREKVSIQPVGPDGWNLVGVLTDVTDRHLTESALAAEKERLAVTLRAMADGVITTDTQGIVQFINHAAIELIGHASDTSTGRPVGQLFALHDARTGEPLPSPVSGVMGGDHVVELPPRVELRDHHGRTRRVEGCCAPIHGPASDVIGTVLVLRDVTERDRLEQQLARASKLESVGVLAGGIAHDFNNILTVILGNLNLAQLAGANEPEAVQALREAERGTMQARELTHQLLTFAKGGDPVRATVLLPEILRQTAEFTVRGSRAKCEFSLPDDLWAVNADKGQLVQVLQNLVLNAVQAMPLGGVIRIHARNISAATADAPAAGPMGDCVHLAVSDTGAGIPPENVARVFDPYFTTKHQGSGLGLATVYSIVTKHQGLIDVQSTAGLGTTFNVWLPAVRGATPAAPADAPPLETALHGRVLLMDDEPAIRRMASMLLQRLGFSVAAVSDGHEAIDRYRDAHGAGEPFDLVIMDLTVPGGMGGQEALEQIRRFDPAVKAIVSSGYSSDPVLANFRAHGFRGCVAKPYQLMDFLRVVRAVLAE